MNKTDTLAMLSTVFPLMGTQLFCRIFWRQNTLEEAQKRRMQAWDSWRSIWAIIIGAWEHRKLVPLPWFRTSTVVGTSTVCRRRLWYPFNASFRKPPKMSTKKRNRLLKLKMVSLRDSVATRRSWNAIAPEEFVGRKNRLQFTVGLQSFCPQKH